MTKQDIAELENHIQLCTVRTQYHPAQGCDRSGLMFGVIDPVYGEFRRTDKVVGVRRILVLDGNECAQCIVASSYLAPLYLV